MAATEPSFKLKPYACCRDRQPFGEASIGLALDINLYFRPTEPRDSACHRVCRPGFQAARYYDFGPINALIAAWQAESRSLM